MKRFLKTLSLLVLLSLLCHPAYAGQSLRQLARRTITTNDPNELSAIYLETVVLQQDMKPTEKNFGELLIGQQVIIALSAIGDLADRKVDALLDTPDFLQSAALKQLQLLNDVVLERATEGDAALDKLGLTVSGGVLSDIPKPEVYLPPAGPGQFTYPIRPDLEPSWVRIQRMLARQGITSNSGPGSKSSRKAPPSKSARIVQASKPARVAQVPKTMPAPATTRVASATPAPPATTNSLTPAEEKYIIAALNVMVIQQQHTKLESSEDATDGYQLMRKYNDVFSSLECPPRFAAIHSQLVHIFDFQKNFYYTAEQAYITGDWRPLNEATNEANKPENSISTARNALMGLVTDDEWSLIAKHLNAAAAAAAAADTE